MSLILSLTSATAATLVQQWARRYLTVTQFPWRTPDQRARTRAILDNARKSNIVWETGPGPFFLHFSLFLFFAGALIYLFNTDHATFGVVVCWVAIFTIAYAGRTVGAISKPEELYYTPFSPLASRLYLGILYSVYQVCSCIKPLHDFCHDTKTRYHDLRDRYREGFLEGKVKAAEENASKQPSKVVALVLERMLLSLGEDQKLEKLFTVIPGFFDSNLVKGQPLDSQIYAIFRQAMDGFLDRTFSSELVSESVRSGRLITCLNAASAVLGPIEVSRILNEVCNGRWRRALQFIEVGHSLRCWDHDKNDLIDPDVRKTVAFIIAHVRWHNDRWIALVKDEFGIPDRILRKYIAQGDDSLSLAILIHITGRFLRSDFPSWGPDVLRPLSEFDVLNPDPGLQQDFCAMWNEIVQEARKREVGNTPSRILHEIGRLYVGLHPDTDTDAVSFSTTSNHGDILLYPFCDIANHRPNSTAYGLITTSSTVPPSQLRGPPYASPHPLLESRPIPSTPDEVATGSTQGNTNPSRISGPAGAELSICSTSDQGSSQQPIEETEIIPPAITSRPLSTSIPMPAVTSLLPSSAASVVPRNEDTARVPGMSPSSSPTVVRPPVPPPQVPSTSAGPPGVHYDINNLGPPGPPLPVEISRCPSNQQYGRDGS